MNPSLCNTSPCLRIPISVPRAAPILQVNMTARFGVARSLTRSVIIAETLIDILHSTVGWPMQVGRTKTPPLSRTSPRHTGWTLTCHMPTLSAAHQRRGGPRDVGRVVYGARSAMSITQYAMDVLHSISPATLMWASRSGWMAARDKKKWPRG